VRELRPSEGILVFGAYLVTWTVLGAGLARAIPIRALVAVTTFVPAVVAYLIVKAMGGSPLRQVGFHRARPRQVLYTVLAAIGLVVPAMALESLVILRFKPPQELIDALTRLITAHNAPELIYVMLVAAVGAALCEEFVFRGILQNSLASMSSGWPAVVGASLIFGVLHDPWRLPSAFALGFFLGMLYLRSKNLLVPIVAHFVINTVAVTAAFLATIYGEAALPDWIAEETSPPLWLVGVSLVIFVLAMRGFWRESPSGSVETP